MDPSWGGGGSEVQKTSGERRLVGQAEKCLAVGQKPDH